MVTQLNNLVKVSPKLTANTHLKKGPEKHGLDRTSLCTSQRIHGTKQEAELLSQHHQSLTPLGLPQGAVLPDRVLKDIGLERSTQC